MLTNDYSSEFSSYNNRIHFDRGTKLIYSDDGHAVNPSTGNPVGHFSAGFGVMVPDSTVNAAFFLSETSNGTIQSFDLKRFSLNGSITIPNVSGSPVRIIRWGNNGLAFTTSAGPLYLIGGNFVH
jgi:hypothetical protein